MPSMMVPFWLLPAPWRIASKIRSQLVSNNIQMVRHEPSSPGCPGPQVPRQRLAQAMPSCCLVNQRAPWMVISSGVSVSCSGSRKRGSWFTALPRGQQIDPVTSQGAFQLHRTFLLPCPPSSGLMPSHISHLSGGPNFSAKLSPSTQPWQGRSLPLCSRGSCVSPPITASSHYG